MAIASLTRWMTGTIPQKILRLADGAMLGRPMATFAGGVNPTTGGGSHGVVGVGDLAVTISSGLTLAVAAGSGWINGTSSIDQGPYFVANPTATTIALAAHSASIRYDAVIVRARDNAEDGSGSTGLLLDKVTGTAGAPVGSLSIPSGCLVLATVQVPATSGAVVITPTPVYATALGALHYVSSATMRPTGAALNTVRQIQELDTGRTYKRQAGAWVPTSGRAGCSITNTGYTVAGSGSSGTIAFDGEAFDTDSYHAGTSTDVVIPAGLGGVYHIDGFTLAAGAVNGVSALSVTVNGFVYGQAWIPVGGTSVAVPVLTALSPGDVVRLVVFNGHSGSLNWNCSLNMVRVCD